MDIETLQRELEEARRARLEAEAAGGDLEQLIEQIRSGFSLKEIELGLAAAPTH